jgi:hypothetical protein
MKIKIKLLWNRGYEHDNEYAISLGGTVIEILEAACIKEVEEILVKRLMQGGKNAS